MSFRICGLLYSVIILGLFTNLVQASAPEETGTAIAIERKTRDSGWGDSLYNVTMLLRDAQGKEDIRKLRLKTLEVIGDGDKSLTVFDEPRDVKGTAFLSFSHITTSDEQWLYIPALKRVKRIGSRNKSSHFMGSEFTFEDLSSFEVEKFSYKYIRDEAIDGKSYFVIESYPKDENTGYSRLISWINQDNYTPHKVVYYNRHKKLQKTLTFHGYELYLEKYWRAKKLSMVNHINGRSTDLIKNTLKLNTGISSRDFNKSSLSRIR